MAKIGKIIAKIGTDIPNQDFDDDKTPTNSLNLDSSPDFEVSPVLPVNPVSTVDLDLPDEPDSPKSTVESEKSKNSKTKVSVYSFSLIIPRHNHKQLVLYP